jgi:prepilin-type N-terminal cleavage/methylation domain-containing protein
MTAMRRIQTSGLRVFKPRAPGRRICGRRAFNLVEMLIALAITSALLTSVMVALNASFMAYQATTEVASTHTIGRLTMHRMLTLIRTGREFGPYPTDPLQPVIGSNVIQFRNPAYQLIELRWDEQLEALLISVDGSEEYALLEGVTAQYDQFGDPVYPFTLEYEKGKHLYRATIDLAIKPDDNMSVDLDGANEQTIRLVASAMPRTAAY